MPELEIPEDLRYTSEHEWVRMDGDRARVGITSYAQNMLGDIVFVTVHGLNSSVYVGQTCGEVESTKSVSDVYAPVAGLIVAVNHALQDAPELINSDPYGAGWIFEMAPDHPTRLDDPNSAERLLTADEYRQVVS